MIYEFDCLRFALVFLVDGSKIAMLLFIVFAPLKFEMKTRNTGRW